MMCTRHTFSLSIAFLLAAVLPSGVHAYNAAPAPGDAYGMLLERFETRSRRIQDRDADIIRLTDALQLPRTETVLICRVRERYAAAPLTITRERLVARLAAVTNTDPRSVEALITNEQYCQTFAPEPYPSLFYAGEHGTEIDRLPTTEESTDAVPPSHDPAPLPPVAPSPSQPPAPAVPQDRTSSPSALSPTTPPLTTMQSLLCRLQQRLRSDNGATPGVLSELAAKYAAEWNVPPDRIERALQDDDLCAALGSMYFANLLQGRAPNGTDGDSAASSTAPSDTPGDIATPVTDEADAPSFWDTLIALPPAVLIVGGMGLLTFLALILLLLAPLFQERTEP